MLFRQRRDNNGVLTLCYTGNVKFDDGSRTAWQCLAVQKADGSVEKRGPVMALPEGYTGHVRDPKVWQHNGEWFMVLGAQDLQKRGKVLLFKSPDLNTWHACGEIAGHGVNGLSDAGYMWECPDLFALDGTHSDLLSARADARSTSLSQYLSGNLDEWSV
jgi:beta-fructofuranosidase